MARRTSARYFNARLTRAELIAGWCYLPFYLVVLSVLLQQLFAWLKLPLDAITLNIAYFAVNLAAVLVIFRNFGTNTPRHPTFQRVTYIHIL